MRTLSAAAIKGRNFRHTVDGKPTKGSILREICDLFYPPLTEVSRHTVLGILERRSGQSGVRNDYRIHEYMDKLKVYYGMDIRRKCKDTYWMVGEYVGSEYKDYFAEQLKKEGL